MKRALISLGIAAALVCSIAFVPAPSLGQARDSLIVAGYNGLTALFVRSAGLLNLKCDGTSMTCAWSGNTLTLSSGSSSSDPCAATITTTTVTLFATASSSTPCNIAIGSNSQRITGTATITSPSATDSFYTAVLTDGSVSIGAASATVTCTSIAVTCTTHTGISSFGDLGTQNIPLYFFASSTTHFVASLASSRPAMSYRAIAGGTNVTISDDGTTATINATGGSSSLPNTLFSNFVDNPSTGAVSAFTINVWAMPVADLPSNNKAIEVIADVDLVATTSNFMIKFGGQAITSATPNSAGANQIIRVDCILRRLTSATEDASCTEYYWNGVNAYFGYTTQTIDLSSGTVQFAVTGAQGSNTAGDVVIKNFRVYALN